MSFAEKKRKPKPKADYKTKYDIEVENIESKLDEILTWLSKRWRHDSVQQTGDLLFSIGIERGLALPEQILCSLDWISKPYPNELVEILRR